MAMTSHVVNNSVHGCHRVLLGLVSVSKNRCAASRRLTPSILRVRHPVGELEHLQCQLQRQRLGPRDGDSRTAIDDAGRLDPNAKRSIRLSSPPTRIIIHSVRDLGFAQNHHLGPTTVGEGKVFLRLTRQPEPTEGERTPQRTFSWSLRDTPLADSSPPTRRANRHCPTRYDGPSPMLSAFDPYRPGASVRRALSKASLRVDTCRHTGEAAPAAEPFL